MMNKINKVKTIKISEKIAYEYVNFQRNISSFPYV